MSMALDCGRRFGCDVRCVVFLALFVCSCTSLQKRGLYDISGQLLNANDNQPISGALIILHEMRHPPIPFPFATDGWHPVAHTRTDASGTFRFVVCITERPFLLDWDAGQPNRPDNEYWGLETHVVTTKLYARPPLTQSFDFWIHREDPSFVRSCL